MILPGRQIRPENNAGFSLMEMAVVLMILGTLMSGILVAVSQSTENNRRSNALAQLRQIEDALYGYAQTMGRLPCPASATSNGQASPATGADCASAYGFVPAATLGLYGNTNGDGLMLDPWQNPIRYAVDSGYNYTNLIDLRAQYTSASVGSLLRVCNEHTCTGNKVTESAPAIILSMGADWSFCTSNNEIENSCETTANGYSLPNDKDFVYTDYAEDQFDDQLIWLSPYLLFSKLLSAGKLP